MIPDHSDHVRSNEPINPLSTRIYRLTWSTMVWVIWDHRSWSESSHRKRSPFCCAYSWSCLWSVLFFHKNWASKFVWFVARAMGGWCNVRPRSRERGSIVLRWSSNTVKFNVSQQVNRISLNHLCNTKLEHRRNCVASKHLGQIKGKKKRFVAPESEH